MVDKRKNKFRLINVLSEDGSDVFLRQVTQREFLRNYTPVQGKENLYREIAQSKPKYTDEDWTKERLSDIAKIRFGWGAYNPTKDF